MPPVLGETFSGDAQKGTLTELPAAYNLIAVTEDYIKQFNGYKSMRGVMLDSLNQCDTVIINGYKIIAKHDYTLGWSPDAKKPNWRLEGAIIINIAQGEFLLIGTGTVLNFKSLKKNTNVGILEIKEISTADGKTVLRYLNGDESHQGRHVRIPDGEWGIQRFKLYEY